MDAKKIAGDIRKGVARAIDEHNHPQLEDNEDRLDNLHVHVKARQLLAICDLALGNPPAAATAAAGSSGS